MRVFCSICKEIFIPYSEVRVTNCGHLYHGSCISRWVEQHKSCPQCRATLKSQPFRVFFDVERDIDADRSTLEHQVETLTDRLRESETALKNLEEQKQACERLTDSMKEYNFSLKDKNNLLKTTVKALKDQVSQLRKQVKEVKRLEGEVEEWKNKATTLEKFDLILNGSIEEVNRMLSSVTISELSVKQLCTYVGALKTQVHKLQNKCTKIAQENKENARNLAEEKKKNSNESEEVVKNLKSANSTLEIELYRMRKLLKDCSKRHAERDEENMTSVANTMQVIDKKPAFNMDLDLIDELESGNGYKSGVEKLPKTITNWEDIVCAGPSKKLVYKRPLGKPKPYHKYLGRYTENKELLRPDPNYAYDGFGGRKKICLGGPTPREEFEKIKKGGEKNTPSEVRHRKIIDLWRQNQRET